MSWPRPLSGEPSSSTARRLRRGLRLPVFIGRAATWYAAEREFKKALELDPKSVPAHRSIAAFYITTNRPLEAERYFKAVTRLAAGATPLLELADYYIQMRRYPEAIAILTPLLTDRIGHCEGQVTKLAAIALADGRSNEAHKLVNDVLAERSEGCVQR